MANFNGLSAGSAAGASKSWTAVVRFDKYYVRVLGLASQNNYPGASSVEESRDATRDCVNDPGSRSQIYNRKPGGHHIVPVPERVLTELGYHPGGTTYPYNDSRITAVEHKFYITEVVPQEQEAHM